MWRDTIVTVPWQWGDRPVTLSLPWPLYLQVPLPWSFKVIKVPFPLKCPVTVNATVYRNLNKKSPQEYTS
jgi:hypothetical protein